MSHTAGRHDFSEPRAAWKGLAGELEGLLAGEPEPIANLANTAALLWHAVPSINWVGFYLLRPAIRPGLRPGGTGDDLELVLGPFQGRPACVRIALGRGVCGTAARERRSICVADVHAFPGHIACDAASRSEVVVPLIDGSGSLLGVLDVDSPQPGRFAAADVDGLERIAAIVTRACAAPHPPR